MIKLQRQRPPPPQLLLQLWFWVCFPGLEKTRDMQGQIIPGKQGTKKGVMSLRFES
jgi:hypothetical protein